MQKTETIPVQSFATVHKQKIRHTLSARKTPPWRKMFKGGTSTVDFNFQQNLILAGVFKMTIRRTKSRLGSWRNSARVSSRAVSTRLEAALVARAPSARSATKPSSLMASDTSAIIAAFGRVHAAVAKSRLNQTRWVLSLGCYNVTCCLPIHFVQTDALTWIEPPLITVCLFATSLLVSDFLPLQRFVTTWPNPFLWFNNVLSHIPAKDPEPRTSRYNWERELPNRRKKRWKTCERNEARNNVFVLHCVKTDVLSATMY